MIPSDEGVRPPHDRQPRQRRLSMELAAWITVVLAVIGIVIAVLTWRLPQSPAGAPTDKHTGAEGTDDGSPKPTIDPTGATPRPTPDGTDGVSGVFLNPQVHPEEGRINLVDLPAELRGRPENVHAVAIKCPTNETTDRFREVVFPLNGRYVEFRGTVVPYFANAQPWWVNVDIRVVHRDNGVDRPVAIAGPSPLSMPDTGAMTAAVERAAQLIIHVECERPGGMAIIRDARLIPTT